MGILDRVKNMFTEEIDEPVEQDKMVVENVEKEEVQKENIKEEILPPKKEERMKPIFFDDQDFATLDKSREEKKSVHSEERYYTKKTETPEKKVFKLSPVISPVYGVLDKNYHKEDITPKRSTPKVTYYDTESITIDEVRKKAYGNLTQEVVETPEPVKKEFDEEVIGSRMQRRYHKDMMFEDLMNPDYEPKKIEKELDDEVRNMEPVSLDDFLIHDEKEFEEDFKDPNEDTLTESDLFNLIDSMYDKEEE